jgi:serine/threonine protein kinase
MTILTDPLTGRILDEKYRIGEKLGKGGMGEVYRATNLRLEQTVAVKVMNPRLLDNEQARQRFLQEARTAVKVQHPNAVSVTDFGETEDGLVYLVMEFLEGSSLRQIINAEAPLDPARAVSLMLQVSAALGAAHDAGVIHRDLKPPNIFLEQRKDAPASVRLLDFGIAKLLESAETDEDALHFVTGGGTLLGTPRYMSPEQCDAEPLTPASDIYSLGVMLYEMLAGETPFNGNAVDVILKHAAEPPRPFSELGVNVPEPLQYVVFHTLAKNPFNRPPDANAFRRELLAVAERLGLERPESDLSPALAKLQEAGHRSSSGRYVIDLGKLREEMAAGRRAEIAPETPADIPVEAVAQVVETSFAPPSFNGLAHYTKPAPVWPKRIAFISILCALLMAGIGAAAWFKLERSLPQREAGDTLQIKPVRRGAPDEPNVSVQPAPTPNAPAPVASPAEPAPSVEVKPPVAANKEADEKPATRASHRGAVPPYGDAAPSETKPKANKTGPVKLTAGNRAAATGENNLAAPKRAADTENEPVPPAKPVSAEGATRQRRVKQP